MATLLKRFVLHVRDLDKSIAFWGEQGLGLVLRGATQDWAVFTAAPGIQLHLKQTYNESELSTSYSPSLHFEVIDVSSHIPRLLSLGAHLDGAIEYAPMRTVASLRAPDGHMLTLVEELPQPSGTGGGGGGGGVVRGGGGISENHRGVSSSIGGQSNPSSQLR